MNSIAKWKFNFTFSFMDIWYRIQYFFRNIISSLIAASTRIKTTIQRISTSNKKLKHTKQIYKIKRKPFVDCGRFLLQCALLIRCTCPTSWKVVSNRKKSQVFQWFSMFKVFWFNNKVSLLTSQQNVKQFKENSWCVEKWNHNIFEQFIATINQNISSLWR